MNRKEYYKNWCKKNEKHLKEYLKKYRNKIYKKNLKIYMKKYRIKNRDKIRKQTRIYKINRRKKDLKYRLTCHLRRRLLNALNRKFIKSNFTLKLIGCSIDKLKKHLESKFKPRMSWSNYGKWQVDHIRPCASFDLSKPRQQRKCFNYKNLQPLWAKDNISKKDKYE